MGVKDLFYLTKEEIRNEYDRSRDRFKEEMDKKLSRALGDNFYHEKFWKFSWLINKSYIEKANDLPWSREEEVCIFFSFISLVKLVDDYDKTEFKQEFKEKFGLLIQSVERCLGYFRLKYGILFMGGEDERLPMMYTSLDDTLNRVQRFEKQLEKETKGRIVVPLEHLKVKRHFYSNGPYFDGGFLTWFLRAKI